MRGGSLAPLPPPNIPVAPILNKALSGLKRRFARREASTPEEMVTFSGGRHLWSTEQEVYRHSGWRFRRQTAHLPQRGGGRGEQGENAVDFQNNTSV